MTKKPLIIFFVLQCVPIFNKLNIPPIHFLLDVTAIENVINIAYCSTNSHLNNIGYSIISILNRTNSALKVYVYTPTRFQVINTIFDKLETEKRGRIKFFFDTINFTLCKEAFRNRWNFWNPFAYARLFMIEKIPVQRVIYIDTDVYGCGDINELWSIELNGNLVAASLDRLPWQSKIEGGHLEILNGLIEKSEIKKMNNTGLTINNYFNSGVLLLNIKELKKMNFTQKCVMSYKKNQTFYPDQDLLNTLTGHRRIILGYKFNKPVFGNYASCILRHFNRKKVTHPVVVRHHEDYDYHYDAVDEFYRLMSKKNRTIISN